jgi:hypothetical protein
MAKRGWRWPESSPLSCIVSGVQVSRSAGRGAPAPDPAMLCTLLQRNQNPSGAEQGCAALTRRSASWNHQITRNPRRTSSPIRPDLVFATHKNSLRRGVHSALAHQGRSYSNLMLPEESGLLLLTTLDRRAWFWTLTIFCAMSSSTKSRSPGALLASPDSHHRHERATR